jgi:hypothetical protein
MTWCCRSPTRVHRTSRLRYPLRILVESCVAYYWPMADSRAPISQCPHSLRNGPLANDMASRPALATLRQAWQEVIGEAARPSDGFFLINESRVARRRAGYPLALRQAFARSVSTVAPSTVPRLTAPSAATGTQPGEARPSRPGDGGSVHTVAAERNSIGASGSARDQELPPPDEGAGFDGAPER